MVLAHSAVSVRPHPHLMLAQGRNSGTRDEEQARSHRHEPHAPQRPTEAHACSFSSHLGEEGDLQGSGPERTNSQGLLLWFTLAVSSGRPSLTAPSKVLSTLSHLFIPSLPRVLSTTWQLLCLSSVSGIFHGKSVQFTVPSHLDKQLALRRFLPNTKWIISNPHDQPGRLTLSGASVCGRGCGNTQRLGTQPQVMRNKGRPGPTTQSQIWLEVKFFFKLIIYL